MLAIAGWPQMSAVNAFRKFIHFYTSFLGILGDIKDCSNERRLHLESKPCAQPLWYSKETFLSLRELRYDVLFQNRKSLILFPNIAYWCGIDTTEIPSTVSISNRWTAMVFKWSTHVSTTKVLNRRQCSDYSEHHDCSSTFLLLPVKWAFILGTYVDFRHEILLYPIKLSQYPIIERIIDS